jgi:hypothetical protein
VSGLPGPEPVHLWCKVREPFRGKATFEKNSGTRETMAPTEPSAPAI